MHRFMLVCWSCGKRSEELETFGPPRFAIELIVLANDHGWRGCIDSRWNRTLVFCSDACMAAAKTKKGEFLKYPPKQSPKKEGA